MIKILGYLMKFFKYDYKSQISDCYFINDPIKDLNDHNNLFTALLNFHKSLKNPFIIF